MPRRAAASIRPVEPDAVHRSRLVTQVINRVMLDGKKSKAEQIVYDALAIVAPWLGDTPVMPISMCMRDGDTDNSSATICVSAVRSPVPKST